MGEPSRMKPRKREEAAAGPPGGRGGPQQQGVTMPRHPSGSGLSDARLIRPSIDHLLINPWELCHFTVLPQSFLQTKFARADQAAGACKGNVFVVSVHAMRLGALSLEPPCLVCEKL